MKIKHVVKAAHQIFQILSACHRWNEVPAQGMSIPATPATSNPRDKPRAQEALQTGVEALAELQDTALRAGSVVAAAHFPGDGCRRQGRHDQARHVRYKSPRLPGSVPSRRQRARTSLSRLSLALCEGTARSAGESAFSTAAITKKRWSFASTRNFSSTKSFRRNASPSKFGRNGSRISAVSSATCIATALSCVNFSSYISKKEQKNRFLERLDNPDKNWKFSANDAKERGFWKDYMHAYEQTIRETATEDSPWASNRARGQQVVYPGRRRFGHH